MTAITEKGSQINKINQNTNAKELQTRQARRKDVEDFYKSIGVDQKSVDKIFANSQNSPTITVSEEFAQASNDTLLSRAGNRNWAKLHARPALERQQGRRDQTQKDAALRADLEKGKKGSGKKVIYMAPGLKFTRTV